MSITAAKLDAKLSYEVRDLTSRDPERVKKLVADCMNSEIASNWDLAVDIVDSLAQHDWPFTRDALVIMGVNPVMKIGDELAYTGVVAGRKLSVLMRDELTPEQIDDLQERYRAAGGEHELRAAPPGYFPKAQ
ncbi:hypothetical protein [Nocardia blacklockiae]|uniref:hypothetical protein n=1 Tax=Nocardia blacklockiae TaxID=480036 RepID=UPI001893773D|nr:hypothetical protein [Nocardia blacklockiae]MBF6171293.1 hypothetical protein [Nocardia blacklockiae]